MTDEPIPSLAEAMAEIRRLQRKVSDLTAACREYEQINGELRARIAVLEGNLAVTFGTLEQPTPDWPTTIEHNIPPNAPPHNE